MAAVTASHAFCRVETWPQAMQGMPWGCHTEDSSALTCVGITCGSPPRLLLHTCPCHSAGRSWGPHCGPAPRWGSHGRYDLSSCTCSTTLQAHDHNTFEAGQMSMRKCLARDMTPVKPLVIGTQWCQLLSGKLHC